MSSTTKTGYKECDMAIHVGNRLLLLSAFNKDNSSKDGHQHGCRDCNAKVVAVGNEKNDPPRKQKDQIVKDLKLADYLDDHNRYTDKRIPNWLWHAVNILRTGDTKKRKRNSSKDLNQKSMEPIFELAEEKAARIAAQEEARIANDKVSELIKRLREAKESEEAPMTAVQASIVTAVWKDKFVIGAYTNMVLAHMLPRKASGAKVADHRPSNVMWVTGEMDAAVGTWNGKGEGWYEATNSGRGIFRYKGTDPRLFPLKDYEFDVPAGWVENLTIWNKGKQACREILSARFEQQQAQYQTASEQVTEKRI